MQFCTVPLCSTGYSDCLPHSSHVTAILAHGLIDGRAIVCAALGFLGHVRFEHGPGALDILPVDPHLRPIEPGNHAPHRPADARHVVDDGRLDIGVGQNADDQVLLQRRWPRCKRRQDPTEPCGCIPKKARRPNILYTQEAIAPPMILRLA